MVGFIKVGLLLGSAVLVRNALRPRRSFQAFELACPRGFRRFTGWIPETYATAEYGFVGTGHSMSLPGGVVYYHGTGCIPFSMTIM